MNEEGGVDRRDRGVAVVGGGPAGMTAALLLARAGRRVTLHEASPQLGGLWASRLDGDGYFRADNSCKVFQSTYDTTPALFALIGTDWREHFVQQHDLTHDWLQPFVAACTWRDLAILTGAFVAHRLGLGRYHRRSVLDFMEQRGLSEPCRSWMRATALGGIAGTLRMTMWELFHRLGSNVGAVLRGDGGPLYWNARPPNRSGGFVAIWERALVEAGVEVRTGSPVAELRLGAAGVVLGGDGPGRHPDPVDAAFLAVPPPALASLLEASDPALTAAFGLLPAGLRDYLQESRYEHLGITWFFDRPVPALPLGGHNVRQGWQPILVRHEQYRPALRPPAVSAVVGSVALDTDFAHHRLGTQAREHDPHELARILWQDEQLRDPGLPDPIDVEIVGTSAATQIVHRGPLPVAAAPYPVFLATNLHGRAPYFTASLEAAIQAGAIAAAAFDPRVQALPMGRAPRLPWTVADLLQSPAEPQPCPLRGPMPDAHA